MNYYQDVIEKFTAVPYPYANTQKVHEFLRENFGDNDIFQPFAERRWITINDYYRGQDDGWPMICFKDDRDALWFQLKWSKR